MPNLNRYNTPEISPASQCDAMDIKAYLSGFVDGEGCFSVSINRSRRHNFGWEIRPSFSVSQNSDRAEVLEILKASLRCGRIRPDRSDKTLKDEVRSVSELVEKVLPHFEAYPLLSSKQHEVERLAEICRRMYAGEHLEAQGFQWIVDLALQMNPSGKRKYLRADIKI